MALRHTHTLLCAIALSLLTSPAIAADSSRKHQQRRPAKKRGLQVVMPRILKPVVNVRTYLKEVRVRSRPSTRVDPVEVVATGYNRGTRVEVLAQQPSAPLVIPKQAEAKELVRQTKGSKRKKPLSRSQAMGRLLGRAIGQAFRYEPVASFTIRANSPEEQQVVEVEKTLAVNAPILIRAKDVFGRAYRKVFTRAAPIAGERWQNGPNNTQTLRDSGRIGTYQAWSEPKNILVSAPVSADGKRAQSERGDVTILGLAAFPRGANVTATNMTTGGQNTMTIIAGDRSRQGGDRLVLGGAAGERIRIDVEIPREAGSVTHKTIYVEVPRANRPAPVVAKRGKKYYRALQQPEKIAVDRDKLLISPAYSPTGRGPGTVRMSWPEGALSRGAVVRVTNLSAKGRPSAMVNTAMQPGASIKLPGAMTDKLKVEVFYPGGDSQTFKTEVPKHEGKPARVDDGRNYYTPVIL